MNFTGPVTKFLSLKIFKPMGSISHCVYLVHLGVLILKDAAIRAPLYFSDLNLVRIQIFFIHFEYI